MDDADLELLDPHPDICALFCYYDRLYFQGRLGACTVSWSGPRMTQCAGTCSYNAGGLCQIRLSGPLLQFRPVPDLKDTLLHEMIHAFLFLTDGNRDHDGLCVDIPLGCSTASTTRWHSTAYTIGRSAPGVVRW